MWSQSDYDSKAEGYYRGAGSGKKLWLTVWGPLFPPSYIEVRAKVSKVEIPVALSCSSFHISFKFNHLSD